MEDIITGKIISILTRSQVAINKGERDGVKKDMIFGIKLLIPELVDPDTSEVLLSGSYYEKGELRIDVIRERVSFGVLVAKARMTGIQEKMAFPVKYEYPPIEDSALSIAEEDWKIRIGDEVFSKKTETKKTP